MKKATKKNQNFLSKSIVFWAIWLTLLFSVCVGNAYYRYIRNLVHLSLFQQSLNH